MSSRPAPQPSAGPAPSLAELATRARALVEPGRRALLGLAGPPGAGKSTLAVELAGAVGADVVGLDGFHHDDARLRERGSLERKGAPETFDAEGFLALVERLREDPGAVPAPGFDRAAERTVPDAVLVAPAPGLVIIEGNYLLLATPPWSRLRPLFDEVWYVDGPDRVERLVARHVRFGRTAPEARERATVGVDGDNARLIAADRDRADLVLPLGWRT